MIVPLRDAAVTTCGGKAGVLGALLRAGLPVPDGFVVAFDVRSSADSEDTVHASGAGQHESVLAVRGVAEVADAVRTCWASLHSPRAISYRGTHGAGHPVGGPVMAVLIHRLVDAEVSGVMFTPAEPGGSTEIEASWGLGPSVVGGTVTPDAYRVAADGSVTSTVSDKRTRLDRDGARLVTRDAPATDRERPTLQDATVARLAQLGQQVAAVLGGPQDIEWAITGGPQDIEWAITGGPQDIEWAITGGPQDIEWAIDGGRFWVLQARPITATLPPASSGVPVASPSSLTGTPASAGTITGTARIVRGPGDFSRVRPGDILVCPYTEPAWTPLLRIAAGVVTETGGVLAHAAIVARELRIPAVVGIPDATTTLNDGDTITLDGAAGTVTTPDRSIDT